MKFEQNPEKQKAITAEIVEWLHHCWEVIENERPLQPDPFYDRNVKLTPAVVNEIIDALEAIFISEIKKYPGYHRGAQGISAGEYLVPPGFDFLPPNQKLAVVQGIDKIFMAHKPK